MPFSFCLPFYCLLFLDNNKRKHSTTVLHLIVIVHKLSIYQCEGPTNKSTKISKYFWDFLILKKGSFDQISKQKGNKLHGKGISMCFAKHTLSKSSLGQLGLRPRLDPLFFSFFTELDLAQPSRPGYWFRPVTGQGNRHA